MLKVWSKNNKDDDKLSVNVENETISHLQKVQSSAISLSVNIGELISSLKSNKTKDN